MFPHRRPRKQISWHHGVAGGCVALLVLALLLARPGVALAQETITAHLAPVAGSTVSGTATITARDDAATVDLDVSNLTPGTTYRALLQAGTCEAPSASFGLLGTFQPGATGSVKLMATTARISATGATIDLTLSLLADGGHIIVISGPGTMACGSIPAATGILPRTGGPSVLLAGMLALGVFGTGMLSRRTRR
jgi:hypothetical protein